MNLGFVILLIIVVLALIATTLGALRVQNRTTENLSVTRVWLLAMLVSALVGPAVGGVWWLGIVSLSSDFVTWEERRQFLSALVTLGTIAGSAVGLTWGLVATFSAYGRPKQ